MSVKCDYQIEGESAWGILGDRAFQTFVAATEKEERERNHGQSLVVTVGHEKSKWRGEGHSNSRSKRP